MSPISPAHYIGAAVVLLIITALGIASGRQVKTARDFSTGGNRAGCGIIVGSLIGTLVGGASTIGTAQLAYTYGFSAWWFTLGGGIGLIALLAISKPLHERNVHTIPHLFAEEYGKKAAITATALTSLGSFLSIVAQLLSGVALITSVSSISPLWATVLTALLMLCYVVFGGVWGAGIVGIAKTLLMYIGVGICGIAALKLGGGLNSFREALPAQQYFSLLARGPLIDIGSCVSLLLGVVTTQTYIQAATSGGSLKICREGILISAVLTPLIGVAGIFVGMYMKLHYPGIAPASAMPTFIIEKLPPLFGGVILATLLVAVVGTGAGLSLGLSAMMTNDIYKPYLRRNAPERSLLIVSRLVICGVLLSAVLFTFGNMGSLILSWSFLSMGLRGAVAFVPLLAALFLSGRIAERYVLASMIISPVLVIIGKFLLPAGIDSLFPGIAASLVIIGAGFLAGKARNGKGFDDPPSGTDKKRGDAE